MPVKVKDKGEIRIGFALGSGSARGWAHIGVIKQLAKMNITADIVCGTSIGSVVGAAYASGQLDVLEKWAADLDTRGIIRFLDINLLARGGFTDGRRLTDFLGKKIGDRPIEDLPKSFAVVSTDLKTGREIWIKEGPVMDAVRSSFALPGIFTPVKIGNRWLVDGGLVNPVPVSLCRAMGADVVIAVNVNGGIVGKHFRRTPETTHTGEKGAVKSPAMFGGLSLKLKSRAEYLLTKLLQTRAEAPGLFDVIAGSINIMQDRITRSRMAGDPPEITLMPRLDHIGLLEFDRAAEAIEEGRESVKRSDAAIRDLFDRITL